MNIDTTALTFLHFIIFISLIGPPKSNTSVAFKRLKFYFSATAKIYCCIIAASGKGIVRVLVGFFLGVFFCLFCFF